MRKELVVFLFGVALCAQGARLSEMHDARPCEGESPLVTNSVDATLLSLQLAQMREVDCSRLYVKARAFAETNRVHCVSDGKPSIALMRDWRRLSEESQSNVVRQVSSSLQGKGLTDPQIFEAGQRVLKKLTRRMFVEIAEVDGEPAVRGVADVVSDDLSYCLLFDRAGQGFICGKSPGRPACTERRSAGSRRRP